MAILDVLGGCVLIALLSAGGYWAVTHIKINWRK